MKQRLIGAIVLIALAVIFLPMLVQGPAPNSGVSDVPLDIPEAPNAGLETRDLPLVAPQAGTGSVIDLQTDPAGENERLPTVDTAHAAQPPIAALPAASAAGNYAVHFGSYASQADARRVVNALADSHLPGHSESTVLSGKPAWRVRIGPYATRAEAEAARLRAAQVRDDVGARVVVLDAEASPKSTATAAVIAAPAIQTQALPPEPVAPKATPAKSEPTQPAPIATHKQEPTAEPVKPVATVSAPPPAVAKPAAGATGFAVQLGAFGNAAEAEKLRDRARAAGLSAFVEQVATDKGTLSRVRLGPVLDRAAADALKTQAKAKLGMDGIVRPHP